MDQAYAPFVKGIGCDVAFSDPVFRRKFREKYGKEVEDDVVAAAQEFVKVCFSGGAHTCKFLAPGGRDQGADVWEIRGSD